MSFRPSGNNIAHVVFKPGVTPHVNGLAGSQIVMDANAPLTEYDVQWTIRHEFGHVLGIPDCYIEFYDYSEEAMVNYQIDIENLMCSRKGHLKEIHISELERLIIMNSIYRVWVILSLILSSIAAVQAGEDVKFSFEQYS